MPNRRVDIPAFLTRVRAAATVAISDQAEESADHVRESLSIDAPPASSPGESPHRRTGNLQAGVETAVVDDGSAVTGHVGSSRADGDPNVPVWLEFGTEQMAPRPYMQPEMDAAREAARTKLTSALSAIQS